MDPVATAHPPATSALPALRVLALAGVLLAFFLGLDLLGQAFGLFGKGFAAMLVERTSNPFVGLFVGILGTTLVQSSSTTTSLTVALVAAGALTIDGAIPVIMGANIGTSVTNSLVSLGHVTRRGEFERAFAGATIHDLFNLLTVAILLPFEIATGYLAKTSVVLASGIAKVGGLNLLDPVKLVIRPVATWIVQLLGGSPILTLIVALGLLFLSLKLLVDLLKALMSGRAERILHQTLFRSPIAAITAGLLMTVMVQSSSITTSVMIPLVAAGIVTLPQAFPFTVGANLGTTVTALIAALSTGSMAAVTVACSHLLFNVTGMLLVYVPPPMRAIPLALARTLGRLTVRNRLYAVAYVALVFFVLPFLLIVLTGAS
ncbi:MAG TPA: Na/Pi symporter [Vicinamibacterales bacterium]|nr:Na/Pi symporter [Vicinamibacterales bacterium]